MPIEPWWETNPATTPRQELGMVSRNSPLTPRAPNRNSRITGTVCCDDRSPGLASDSEGTMPEEQG